MSGNIGIPTASSDRLDSWKEIASYIKRDVRTAQRWEKQEGLPVHRLQHDVQGTVFAYRSELDAWWRSHQHDDSGKPPVRRVVWLTRRTGIVAGVLLCSLVLGGIVLSRSRTKAGSPPIRSLAVLPLQNLSGDPTNDYFADSMTDEVITDLAKLKNLRVISRTSVLQYKGTKKTGREIGRELDVDAVVEGSVIRSADRVRITAQMIRTATDSHVWADSFDGEIRDALTLQSDIARAIAQRIQSQVAPSESARFSASRRVDPEAYQLYLQGLYYWNMGTASGISKSPDYFRRAIERDPNFGKAYMRMAWVYMFYDKPRAKELAKKALTIDDTLAGAHAALAYASYSGDWNWAAADQEFKRAIELEPNNPDVLVPYAQFLGDLGRYDEAIPEMLHAMEVSPLSLLTNSLLGILYFRAERYDDAIRQLKTALALDPTFSYAHMWLGKVYVSEGIYDQATIEYEKAFPGYEKDGNSNLVRGAIAYMYAKQGRRQQALRLLQQVMNAHGTTDQEEKAYVIAVIWTALGDKDHAFEWLEKAYTEHSPDLMFVKSDRDLKPLRSDPRFLDLVRRVGLP